MSLKGETFERYLYLETEPESEIGREWGDFHALWTRALCKGKQGCKEGVHTLRYNYTINCN